MKNILFSVGFLVLFVSFVSASIIINQQPKELYNLGDVMGLPVKLVAVTDTSSFFQMYLICNGMQTEIYKEYVVLTAGEEKEISSSIPLIKSFIGNPTGVCTVKSIFDSEYVLTNEFKISDKINIKLTPGKTELSPEELLIIEGEAKKENGELVNGFADSSLLIRNVLNNITFSDSVRNGYFHLEFVLPKGTPAGQHAVNVKIYEKDSEGEITNIGFLDYLIVVRQVPTNLETIFENQDIEPGTKLLVKAVLHDQTGEKIDSNATITIKNSENKIIEQVEIGTDKVFEFPILYNEVPAEWSATSTSNGLANEAKFKILSKEAIKSELVNKTLTITNVGNVIYCNKNVLVKIGDSQVKVDVCLDIGESQKYTLSAPNGEYQVNVLTDEGSGLTGMATLTGKTVGVKKASGSFVNFIKFPLVWIFIMAVLGFVVFMIYRKGYKRSFFGKTMARAKKATAVLKGDPLINTRNRAELSMSIKGDKQNASVISLNIKNFDEVLRSAKGGKASGDGGVDGTMKKLSEIAESSNALIYENQENIFFILAPAKTRTFKNEKIALNIADTIRSVLTGHNKLFKPKIEFGISLNSGEIIAKQEAGFFKFMSMGTLMTFAKKISVISGGEIALSEGFKNELGAYARTEKNIKDKIVFYVLREVRREKEENKKFIGEFLKRIEK